MTYNNIFYIKFITIMYSKNKDAGATYWNKQNFLCLAATLKGSCIPQFQLALTLLVIP